MDVTLFGNGFIVLDRPLAVPRQHRAEPSPCPEETAREEDCREYTGWPKVGETVVPADGLGSPR